MRFVPELQILTPEVVGRWVSTSIIASLMLGASLASAQEAPPAPAVTVVVVQPEQIMLSSELPGRVVASAVAEVRPQVNGIITDRFFTEGSTIKQG